MPRKRFTFKRRSGGRRRSFGPRIRAAKEPGRYETSDFFIESFLTLPNSSGAETLRAFPIASLASALNQDPNTGSAQLGIIMGNMVKSIELGGIVFDYGLDHTGAYDGEIQPGSEGLFTYMHAMVLDDVDTEANSNTFAPNFINNWSPWTSGWPTAALFTSIPTPASDTKDAFRPMRMLWRKTDSANLGANFITGEGGLLYVPDGQTVVTRRGTINRRLRVSVNDSQGLYLLFATRNSPDFAVASGVANFRLWFQGQLYWKVRY